MVAIIFLHKINKLNNLDIIFITIYKRNFHNFFSARLLPPTPPPPPLNRFLFFINN